MPNEAFIRLMGRGVVYVLFKRIRKIINRTNVEYSMPTEKLSTGRMKSEGKDVEDEGADREIGVQEASSPRLRFGRKASFP